MRRPPAPAARAGSPDRVDHRPGLRRRPRLPGGPVERGVLLAADRHPVPVQQRGLDGAAIEIYHGAHGRFETKSPVRTFVAYKIKNEPYLLAAYTAPRWSRCPSPS